jgi:hypothetical protein
VRDERDALFDREAGAPLGGDRRQRVGRRDIAAAEAEVEARDQMCGSLRDGDGLDRHEAREVLGIHDREALAMAAPNADDGLVDRDKLRRERQDERDRGARRQRGRGGA